MAASADAALKGILIDLDGTLYNGQTMIEGADAFILLLREKQIPYLFVTNNSTTAPEAVASRLRGMGIPAESTDVCTSAIAAASYIAERQPGARVFVVGETGLHESVAEAGLQVVEGAPDFVVQGIDRKLTYARLAAAVKHIRGGAQYVLTNPDVLLPSDGELLPGAGTIAAMLRTATGIEPVLIGKPSSVLMHVALEQLGLSPEETWVIGDNPATDIAAGHAAGCPTILLLTGLATKADYADLLQRAGCEADVVLEDLHKLIAFTENKS
ncbi:TIGR01457 family HAD-type hydrolase [Paenibacillus nasutitermitis]|uniref:Acid sugar phosphatase n=1 Tax=Paenibacillus nasutitermitis TaxID=1652958 RepID=A0A916YVL2_9BACL|nr:TIGR01457 family HAD-type hydrolase [Paenibacillus nasutitermitis]GGD63871.1 haloacid dehalogenase [Paenibacillus nasutitermitis]